MALINDEGLINAMKLLIEIIDPAKYYLIFVTIRSPSDNRGHEGVVAVFCRNGGGGNPLV
jgi:hypothetical protein